jgi:hypothetical protein
MFCKHIMDLHAISVSACSCSDGCFPAQRSLLPPLTSIPPSIPAQKGSQVMSLLAEPVTHLYLGYPGALMKIGKFANEKCRHMVRG